MNLAAHLFDVARRQPQSPAVSDGVRAWSYGEFALRVSCLAGGLVAHGLEPGERVMLCMGKLRRVPGDAVRLLGRGALRGAG